MTKGGKHQLLSNTGGKELLLDSRQATFSLFINGVLTRCCGWMWVKNKLRGCHCSRSISRCGRVMLRSQTGAGERPVVAGDRQNTSRCEEKAPEAGTEQVCQSQARSRGDARGRAGSRHPAARRHLPRLPERGRASPETSG